MKTPGPFGRLQLAVGEFASKRGVYLGRRSTRIHTAIFHNLMAHPETKVQVRGEVRAVRARVAADEERERLYPRFVSVYPAYDFYERNARGRRIPVVILERR